MAFSLSDAIVYLLYIIGMVRVGDSLVIQDVIRRVESTLESLNHDSLEAIHAAQNFNQ